MEKHIRFAGGTASDDGSTEDVRDRQFGNHLNRYYDGVVAVIRAQTPSRSLVPVRPKES